MHWSWARPAQLREQVASKRKFTRVLYLSFLRAWNCEAQWAMQRGPDVVRYLPQGELQSTSQAKAIGRRIEWRCSPWFRWKGQAIGYCSSIKETIQLAISPRPPCNVMGPGKCVGKLNFSVMCLHVDSTSSVESSVDSSEGRHDNWVIAVWKFGIECQGSKSWHQCCANFLNSRMLCRSICHFVGPLV